MPRREGILLCCCLLVGRSVGPPSFRSFSFALVANAEMEFGVQIYQKNIYSSSSVLGMIKQFLTELCPLEFEKFQ
jgi:hypothetical protein